MVTYEEHNGKTPNGGVKSVILYTDRSGNNVDKSKATNCIIIEYDKDDEPIQRTYGTLTAKKGSN